ncbi:MAG: energy transducer TonB, partial [Pontixanthobacter sp.]
MSSQGISRGEWIGLGAAVLLHVALLAVLLTEPEVPAVQEEALPEAITVSLADDVGLQASAPEQVLESRASMGPVLSDVPAPSISETAPVSRPTPMERPTIRQPDRATTRPTTTPATRTPATRTPATTTPAARTPAARTPTSRAPTARRATPTPQTRAAPSR